MNRIGIFDVHADLLTFESMRDGPYKDHQVAAYYKDLAEKLRAGSYFPTPTSTLMALAVPPQRISFADVRNSLHLLASYADNQSPDLTGIFGITHLARYAQRYGFEIIDDKMLVRPVAILREELLRRYLYPE